MATKTKEKRTLKNMVVFDPITRKFTQKGHIVRGKKLLQYEEGICEYCGNKYPKHRKKQRFCNNKCRMKWWIRQQHDGKDPDYGMTDCAICGNEFQKTRPWSKYCGSECQAKSRLKNQESPQKSTREVSNEQIADMRCQGSTLQQIGDKTGITRERVRQILNEKYGTTNIKRLTAEKRQEGISESVSASV